MTQIELRDGYFIEVDELNATLKQRYKGTSKKTGEKINAVRTIGYYSKPVDAMERFVVLNRLDKMDGMTLSLSEYLEALKKADKEVQEFLAEIVKE